MANVLVYQMDTRDSKIIAEILRLDGHDSTILEYDWLHSKPREEIPNTISKNKFDILLIHGGLAYTHQINRELEGCGNNKPLFVAYFHYIPDYDLSQSRCDFGVSESNDNHKSLAGIVRNLSQNPIPETDDLIHNPKKWMIHNGVYVRKYNPEG